MPFKPVHKNTSALLFHAVSVGENHAILPLVQAMEKKFPSDIVVITNITHTGYVAAKKLFPNAVHQFLPLDMPWSVFLFLRQYRWRCVCIAESDIWPEFCHQLKRKKVPVCIVNGVFSEKTYKRSCLFPIFATWRLSCISVFCMQTSEYANRLKQFIPNSVLVCVTGNIKADVPVRILSQNEKEIFCQKIGVSHINQIITLASTHEGEEKLLIQHLVPLFQKYPHIKILVVPRHPERFSAVFAYLSQEYPSVALFSDQKKNAFWQIMVVDAMGLLPSVYQISTVAIVAGSFVPHVGGHNILEPAGYGIPSIVGPFTNTQKAIIESAKEKNGVFSIQIENLCATVESLLMDQHMYTRTATYVRSWHQSMLGATDKTVAAICNILLT